MISSIVAGIKRRVINKFKLYRDSLFWKKIPELMLRKEIYLGNFGGSRLFIHDIDGDGKKEFLFLQTAGMFKAKLFQEFPEIKKYMDSVYQGEVFCLTATDDNGNIIWQTGVPQEEKKAYLCHAPEKMLAFGDVNGDGIDEILVLDAVDNLLILEASTGRVIDKIKLPNDTFSIVYYTRTGCNLSDFIILVGVMDRSYNHSYANPWLIIDSNFKIVSNRDYLGAGHNVAIEDFNNDGIPELLIGYQLVNANGEVIWTLDIWQGREINSIEQHADNIEVFKEGDTWLASVSGSDSQYLFDLNGKTVWKKQLPHPQCSVIGEYKGEKRIFVANQRECMNSFSVAGVEKWKGLLPEYWPKGKPYLKSPARPIHINDPMNLIKQVESDLILYKEGGWPYLCDFDGKVVFKLFFPTNADKRHREHDFRRINDIGLSYDAEVVTNSNDLSVDVFIYDRNYLWNYKLV